jgi:hypothetical protein
MTPSGHWVGNNKRPLLTIERRLRSTSLEAARDNLKLLGAILERQLFDRQKKVEELKRLLAGIFPSAGPLAPKEP